MTQAHGQTQTNTGPHSCVHAQKHTDRTHAVQEPRNDNIFPSSVSLTKVQLKVLSTLWLNLHQPLDELMRMFGFVPHGFGLSAQMIHIMSSQNANP